MLYSEDITYNFSGAGHGKISADGIGGYLKKFADDQVKYGTDVSDFDSLLSILRSRVKSVYIDSLSCFDCFNENLCKHFSMGRIDYSSNHKVEKTNKKLMQITEKSEDSLQEAEK